MIGAPLVLTFLVTALGPLQRIFGTAALTSRQWGICLLGPIALLAFLEMGKLIDRHVTEHAEPPRVSHATLPCEPPIEGR